MPEPTIMPQNQYDAALLTLKQYYRQVVRDMVHEIVIHRDDFNGGDTPTAREIVAKHAERLRDLQTVYQDVARYSSSEMPHGTEPLGKEEFRCFSCGYVIHRTEERCKLCGWTWK